MLPGDGGVEEVREKHAGKSSWPPDIHPDVGIAGRKLLIIDALCEMRILKFSSEKHKHKL